MCIMFGVSLQASRFQQLPVRRFCFPYHPSLQVRISAQLSVLQSVHIQVHDLTLSLWTVCKFTYKIIIYTLCETVN